jgi:hypothetical protein
MYNEWFDFDGKLTEEIRNKLEEMNIGHPFLIREDIFDKYPNEKSIRRVYFKKSKTD